MDIELLDVSDIKKPLSKRYNISESPGEKCEIKRAPIQTVSKESIICEEISCARSKSGLADNCAICEDQNKDIFIKCKTKYH